jgi:AcrR family transcriptional regulator
MIASATPSRQQRRTERTRARLLEAGLELFLEQGYDGVSIGEVTKRADLGAGTYYLHFRDKRGLYEAVVRQALMDLRQRWLEERKAKTLGRDAWAEISLMVQMVLESLMKDPDVARLVLLDGPPLETWLVDEIGREMAQFLGDRVRTPELVSHLVIGATLNSARWALNRPREVPTKRLVNETVAFCAAGVAARRAPKRKGRS